MSIKSFLYIILMVLALPISLLAQFPESPPEDSVVMDSSKIDILNIDTYKEQTTPQGVFRDLIGNVHLKQKDMHIWCDTGYMMPLKQVIAHGNVQMLQDDSIRIFSDSLYYDGLARYSKLRQNVVLMDTSMTLFTDKLNYDLNTRIATFPEGSLIESDTTTMISKKGTYNANTNIAHFSDSVRITNPNYKLTADSLAFNTQTEVAYFLGPTKVYNDEKMVYCEDGFYDSQKNYAELYKNARFENHEDGKNDRATGDTIIYDGAKDIYYLIGNAHYENEEQEVYADTILMDGKTEKYSFRGNQDFRSKDSTQQQSIKANFSDYDINTKNMIFRGDVEVAQENQFISTDSLDYNSQTKNGLARGNVVWRDTSADMQITCGEAFYNDSTKYLKAHRDPILTTIIDQDTMWLKADTLVSLPDTSDMDIRNLIAFHHVRVFKSDIQSTCDSLFYDGRDSTFQFFIDPILWVDGTQFTAKSIHVQMKNSSIHRVFLYNNSFIVNTNEAVYFNQIKGEHVTTKFVEGNITSMEVLKKGETVYYALDGEDKYMGVNDVDCEKMMLYFSENQVKRIRFQGKPNAVLYPMHQINHNTLLLEGFRWLDSTRIKSKYEFLGLPEPIVLINPIDSIDQLEPLDSNQVQDSTLVSNNDSLTPSPSINKNDSDNKKGKLKGNKKGAMRNKTNAIESKKGDSKKEIKNKKGKLSKKKQDKKGSD